MKITGLLQVLFLTFSGALFSSCGSSDDETTGASTKLNVSYSSSDTVSSFNGLSSDDGGADADGSGDGDAGTSEVEEAEDEAPFSCVGDTTNSTSENTSGIDKIVATISRIRFFATSGGHFDVSINKTFDLLDLGSVGAGPSSGVEIPQNTYKEIRIYFSCAEIQFTDEEKEALKITANDSIMFQFNPRLDLNGVDEDDIKIYFDVSSGLSWNSDEGWKLNQAKVNVL